MLPRQSVLPLLCLPDATTRNPTAPVLQPIVVTSPVAGQTYHVGDTLHIRWEENDSSLTGIIIFLSVNANRAWVNNGNSLTGSQQMARASRSSTT